MKSKKKIEGLQLRGEATLTVGEKIEVYYNIHKGGFSILSRDKQNPMKGKVIAHSEFVLIEDATFHINSKKLEQIREMNRKTVYAVVRGVYAGSEQLVSADFHKGYCNPYKTGTFIDWASKEQITKAKHVYFYDKFFSYK
ncbi:hypothetical protein MZM54_05440 [[Brevibacterium] frigoritolerans]|nr:hypothetical protein [Peribacillus frigoritolerans]